MSTREVDREIGDLGEFEKQVKICRKRSLEIIGPVYKAWRPSTKVSSKTMKSKSLKNVPTLALLTNMISFVKVHEVVTVRQIYYGLVSIQMINNNTSEYNRVVRTVKRARLAGLISFDSIIDDTREAEKTSSWDSIEEIIKAAIEQYRSDWWSDQPYYVEVWLEKRALRRIFYPITDTYDVHLCVGGGYQSWSQVWEARKRFESRAGQKIVILYFGDLDPSGKDMARDIQERFNEIKISVTVKEIALTRKDIERFKLPKNPFKIREGKKRGDPRKNWYIKKYGIDYGVELDALPPDVLKDKIEEAITNHADLGTLFEKLKQDERDKEKWRKIIGD